MSFVELARKKNKKSHKVGFGFATETKYELIDGNKVLVKRPQKGFEGLQSYQDAFKEEFENGFKLNNINVLAYRDFFRDGQGFAIQMETVDCKSLEQVMHDHPALTANKQLIDKIINEIIKGTAYLHAHGIYHFNLTPANILLADNNYTVKLVNPVYSYMNCIPPILAFDGNFSAPELLKDGEQPDARCDIFSIGKIIDYIYSYASLPIKYKSVVKKATANNPSDRYQNTQELKNAINAGKIKEKIFKVAMFLCAIALITGFTYMTIQDYTEKETQYVAPAKNSRHTLEIIKNNPAEYVYQNDSNMNMMTNEEIQEQQIYDKKAANIFKKQFSKKANAIISKMYTAPNMNGDEKAFKAMSVQGFGELGKIQNELIKEYNIDPNEAAKMAQEVINQITQQKMSDLQNNRMNNE